MKIINSKSITSQLSYGMLLCMLMLMPWQLMSAKERALERLKTELNSEARHALVIGNSTYSTGRLANPVNDVRDMARLLGEMGFKVIAKENLGRIAMGKVIRDFGRRLQGGGVGLFYFAGHGMQVNGHNFLIPVDANIQVEDEVPFQGVDVSQVLAKMESAKNRLNLVVLDACRNNPYARSFRSSVSGLAKVDAPVGTLIAYATSPGSTAADGRGRNGIFTKYLLRYMKQPKLEVGRLFRKVRRAVRQATNNKQIPWEASSLEGDFYFIGKATSRLAPDQVVMLDRSYLTIETIPFDAKVKIMNISPKYQAGMALEPGDYHFVVSAPDYQSLDQWRHLESGEQTIRFELVARPKLDDHPAGKSFRDHLKDGGEGPAMVVISSGQFDMGGDYRSEMPMHRVLIKRFLMGKYEVTFAEYDQFAEVTGRNKPNDGGWGRANRPVINVGWDDAIAYIQWLSAQTEHEYRLPSEAEWEYSARAGTTTAYSWGDEADHDKANYGTWSCCKGLAVSRTTDQWVKTAPVGQFSANVFGLYDMHGNVWEWVKDCWHGNYKDAPSDGSAWTADCMDSRRVLRSGSWLSSSWFLRSAFRTRSSSNNRSDFRGFRIARDF